MRFEDLNMSTLMAKLGPVDDFADIWCKLMRLRTQCQRFKNEGIIGPQLQSQCDQLASELEKISDAPNSSKLFQCMVDATLAYALQIVAQVSDLSPSSTADNSSTKELLGVWNIFLFFTSIFLRENKFSRKIFAVTSWTSKNFH